MTHNPINLTEELICQYCFDIFDYKRSLTRHLAQRPTKCLERAKHISNYIEQRVNEINGEKRDELSVQVQVAQKTQIEEYFVKRSSNNTPRKKIYSLFEIIRNSDVDIDTLMEVAISGSKKTVELIERIIFITRPPKDWGIKLIDFGRQKYSYYDSDKKKWINTTIDDITENFMLQMTILYDRVIIQKSKELDEINKKFPYHASDEMAEKNTLEADKIHEKYAFCTNYRLCLLSGIDEPGLYSALRTRLLNVFNKYL